MAVYKYAVYSGTSNDYKVSRAIDSTYGYVYYIQDIRDGSPDG